MMAIIVRRAGTPPANSSAAPAAKLAADANAAADDATQSASLANCLLFFGDVMNVSEMAQRLR